MTMNDDQIEGSTREAVGKLREGVGHVLDDRGSQTRGAIDQAAGALQHGYGEVRGGAKTLAEGAPAFENIVDTARNFGRRVDESLQERFGSSATVYVLAAAVAFLGAAVLWAGRERD